MKKILIIILISVVFLSIHIQGTFAQSAIDSITKKHDRIVDLIKQKHFKLEGAMKKVKEAAAIAGSLKGEPNQKEINKINEILDEAENLLNPEVSVVKSSARTDNEELQKLNTRFLELLKQKTPSWEATPAVLAWWEAKVAKEKGDFSYSEQKLNQAIELIIPIQKVSYDEILKFAKVKKHPLASGKLKPPKNGAYTGVWRDVFRSPLSDDNSIDRMIGSHSVLRNDVLTWYSMAPAYDYNLDFADKFGYLSWDNLFSFEESLVPNMMLMNDVLIDGEPKRMPLVLTYKQYVELLAQYGTVPTLAWFTGRISYSFEWAGGDAYKFEKLTGKSPITGEVIDGKWDDYIKKTAEEIKNMNIPMFLELNHEFNLYTSSSGVALSFGENGDKTFIEVCNPGVRFWRDFAEPNIKQRKNPVTELKKKIDSDELKNDCEELRTLYGDPAIWDGVEREIDMWQHVHDIFDEVGVTNVAWFQHMAGWDNTGEAEEEYFAPHPWDRGKDFDSYWPGDNYIDWIGMSAYYKNVTGLTEIINSLYPQIYNPNSLWKDKPLILMEFAYQGMTPETEIIPKIYSDLFPNMFPKVKAFTHLDFPPFFGENNNTEEINAWRSHVANNNYYVQYPEFYEDNIAPGRITDLKASVENGKIKLAWTAPGDDENIGTASYYIVKYRTDPIDTSSDIAKDFREEPWRLWSRYETKDVGDEPIPGLAGTKQNMTIDLSEGIYYFGIQSVDEVPYNSRISNIVEVEVKQ